ncbi:Na+/H+/K+ antiporter P-type ATPase [Botrytis cinerea]
MDEKSTPTSLGDRDDEIFHVQPRPEARIRFGAQDEEAGRQINTLPRMTRTATNSSQLSATSSRRRRVSIDPATALPITYRTVSFAIEETKEKQRIDADRAKKGAAAELGDLEWHILSTDDVVNRLETSLAQGLLKEQVEVKTKEFGKNMPSKPPSNLFSRVFGYLFGGFGSVLLIGGILVTITYEPLGKPNPAQANLALAIVLYAVFVIQALFNAWQDWSSSRTMASISGMLPDDCFVLRNGNRVELAAVDLVPGDILYIRAGNKLPADVRFVEISSDAKFDRSILTGESQPIAGSIENTDLNYLETQNIGMQGTHCISGSAIGVTVSTGDKTVFGKIAKLTNTPKTGMTTLQKEILRFIIIICSIMIFFNIVVIVCWSAWLRHSHPDWISTAGLIIVAVAFIPEGLPIALTASLTITANIMKSNQVLCKSLKTVETLGAVSVICSDKTGTLTKNKMFATECSIAEKTMTPEQAVEFQNHNGKTTNSVAQLRSLAGLCNAGEFDAATLNLPLAERKIAGDATDQAVLRLSETFGEELAEWRNEDLLVTIKGAPDILVERCTKYVGEDGHVYPLNPEMKSSIEEIKNRWSSQGKRVILLARKVLPGHQKQHRPENNTFEAEIMRQAGKDLTLVGLVGIVDPPRDEILDVVKVLRRAGIRIFMVTGDFKLTAQAIAIECGIITTPSEMIHDVSKLSRNGIETPKSVSSGVMSEKDVDSKHGDARSITLSGPDLMSLNDNQWDQLCQYDEIVFARTTPEQKLRIVKEFQKRENIVGMTGDGVNDAPSLKAADIGIALGSGSDIAIEAADMVLLDSFGAVVEAVKYGRVVFDNLKKTIIYLLPAGTFCEFLPIITNVILGLPQILSSFLMIMICCLTDCAGATVLAYEQPEADVLLRKPRDVKKDKLVDWRLLFHAYIFLGVQEAIASFAVAYWYCQRRGVTFSILWLGYGKYPPHLSDAYVQQVLAVASSIYFVNLVIMQWFNLMATRTRRLSIFQQPPAFNKATQNLWLFPAILFALVVIFIFLYIPGLASAINSSPIPVEYFFLPLAFGMWILFTDEMRKFCVRKWPEGWLARIAW